MKKLFFAVMLMVAGCLYVTAAGNARFHNEASDTTRINELLVDAAAQRLKTPEERVAYIAKKFIGTPYVAHTLEQEPEMVTVNLDELDCTTFVETVMALAYTVGEGRTSWRDFVYNLERLRYRGGEADGYSSRLHYISDWAVDNIHRGNIEDATRLFPKINYIVRSIDFMTENRDKYPALADDETYAKMKNVEIGYRNHRFPYLKTLDLGDKFTKAAFHEGDVVALVTTMKNLDVTHMGIIVKIDGEPYLLHASSSNGKVEISGKPLVEFMKRNRSLAGVRVFRLKE